jgi:iron complex transport system substrate-binding protein
MVKQSLKQRVFAVFILSFMAAMPVRYASAQAAVTVQTALGIQVTDDRGVLVRLDKSPQRIVSLLPSLSESVCELGQCQRLVGVDRYSNWPLDLAKVPKVGGGLDPNIEAVVALKPDLVLIATSSRASERLETLGLKVVALEPKSHADVQRVLSTVGRILAIPEEIGAKRVWRLIDAGVSAAAQSLPAKAKGVRVYFEANAGPYAAGEASFIGETLSRLGAKNIVPKALGAFPKINPEFVVRADPDVIMLGERSATKLEQRPGWAGMRAIRAQRVCVFSSDQGDILVRAGPRMAEGARLMADCLKNIAP